MIAADPRIAGPRRGGSSEAELHDNIAVSQDKIDDLELEKIEALCKGVWTTTLFTHSNMVGTVFWNEFLSVYQILDTCIHAF